MALSFWPPRSEKRATYSNGVDSIEKIIQRSEMSCECSASLDPSLAVVRPLGSCALI